MQKKEKEEGKKNFDWIAQLTYWVGQKFHSFFLNFLNFFSFIFINWRLIMLQYCSGFSHTLT